MYDFIDVNEQPSAVALPTEAVKIDGVYIENIISGYKTLSVSGRELIGSEISEKQIGNMNGSQYNSKRIPARDITVKYRMHCADPEDFRDKFNVLSEILDKEQVEFIFNDEQDKYFIGTVCNVGDVIPGHLNVVGEYIIHCTDPFKHSKIEKSFTAAPNTDGVLEVAIINNGTESTPIDYTIQHTAENGYIGIVSERGVLQFGKAEEADGEKYKKNEMLTNCSSYLNWSNDAKWKDDKGENGENHASKTAGTFQVQTIAGHPVLALKTAGSSANWWNGAMKTIDVVDSNGDIGAANLYSYCNSWFETELMGQTGCQTFSFIDANNKVICRQSIWKTDTVGNTACIEWGVGGDRPRCVKSVTFEPNWQNPFRQDMGHSDMRKEGDRITFYWAGTYPSVVVPELKDVKVAKVQLYIGQWGARNMGNQFVTRNYFRGVGVQIMGVEHYRDIPNRYQPGDEIFVDGSASKVYVNGMIRPGDEIKGSKYFLAPPGETKIQFGYSDFCEETPTIQAKIREAWL